MKVRIAGDHSDYHCGSHAVMEFMRGELEPLGTLTEGSDFDLLVVNGEGSMHDDSKACRGKMQEIGAALDAGKRVWLVNTVWQANSLAHTRRLRRIERIGVRETLSQRELRYLHGTRSEFFLDFSYFAAIDEGAPATDFRGSPAVTDFYARPLRNFARLTTSPLAAYPYIDMMQGSWSSLVRSLRTTPLLITGRHHAVYAACRARTPFVAMAGNTYKIEGLLDAARSPIPVATHWRHLMRNVEWAQRNRAAYDALFDWMEAQPRWSARRWIESPAAVGGTAAGGYWGWLGQKLRRRFPG